MTTQWNIRRRLWLGVMTPVVALVAAGAVAIGSLRALRDQVGGYVFIYRSGSTPHKMFEQAVDEIGEKNIVGVILNDVKDLHRG